MPRPLARPLPILVLGLLLGLGAAACGGDDSPGAAEGGGEAVGATTTSAPAVEGWRCHPALTDDPCTTADLRTTRFDADLNATVEDAPPAAEPAADCFYLPPAAADEATAAEWIRIEAARFRTVCQVFAPEVATGDGDSALAAFDRYLAGEGLGDPSAAGEAADRPFVLLGHGDGAALVARIVQERVAPDPALRARLLSVMAIGGPAAHVPAGQPAGGTFADLPVCTDRDQTACVLGFHAYESGTTPALDNAWFAGLPPGGEAVCTNPTGLDGSKGQLRASTFPVDSPLVPPPVVSGLPPVETPFVTLEEYYVAECLAFGGGVRYLWVDRTIDPTDQRAPGPLSDPDLAAQHLGLPQHDLTLTLGDLVFLAGRQLAAHAG